MAPYSLAFADALEDFFARGNLPLGKTDDANDIPSAELLEDRVAQAIALVQEVRADRRGLAEALGGIRAALTDNDRKAEERSRNLHKRIDPLVGAISAATHSVENHLADHRAKNA